MVMDFAGHRVIVLGSSSGIGLEIAKQLAEYGASICLVGRDKKKLKLAHSYVVAKSKGCGCHLQVSADLHKADAVEIISNTISKKWGGHVDALVLNSGGPPLIDSITAVPNSDWYGYFQSLFMSQIGLVHKYLKSMQENEFGRIVSITSSSVLEPISGLAISNSIRAALVYWLKTLSNEVAPYNITVNSVAVGKIDTDRLRRLNEQRASVKSLEPEQIVAASLDKIPAKRYGEVEEVANAVLFLLRLESSYITGSIIRVDGGMVTRAL